MFNIGTKLLIDNDKITNVECVCVKSQRKVVFINIMETER